MTRTVILILAFLQSALPGQTSTQRTLAVLDFSNNSIVDRDGVEPLCKGLAEIFSTELSRVATFSLVEREHVRKVITELEFQQSEYVDPKSAQQMGKLLGAEYLVLGGFVHSYGEKIRVDLRIVQVETGLTIRGEEASGDIEDLFDVVEDLTKKLTRYFKVGFPDGFDRDAGPSNRKAALLFARAVEHEDKSSDLLAAGKKKEAEAELMRAIELLKQAVGESPDFRVATEKLKKLESRVQTVK